MLSRKLFRLTNIKRNLIQKRYKCNEVDCPYGETMVNLTAIHHKYKVNFGKAGDLLSKLKFDKEYKNGNKSFHITLSKDNYSNYEQLMRNYTDHRIEEIQNIINWLISINYKNPNKKYGNVIQQLRNIRSIDILDKNIEYKILHDHELLSEYYNYLDEHTPFSF